MKFVNVGVVLVIQLLSGLMQNAQCIRCFECVSRSRPGESNPCLAGDGGQIRRAHCIGPSVCATYFYEEGFPGNTISYHITRGCQALRYGATCEDIFHELRSKGEILPGRHTCTTCSADLCNSVGDLQKFGAVCLTLILTTLTKLIA